MGYTVMCCTQTSIVAIAMTLFVQRKVIDLTIGYGDC
jgi:hypothetical protein